MPYVEPNTGVAPTDETADTSVVAIVVSWNSGEWLIPTVQALTLQSHRNIRIVVWDNASNGGTLAALEQIEADFPEARVVRSSVNLGFAAGNNRAALEYPDTAFILTVNPDAVLDPD